MGNEISEFYTPPVRGHEPLVVLRDYDHRAMPYVLEAQGALRPQVPGSHFSKA